MFPVGQQVDRREPFNKDRVDGARFAIFGLDLAYPLTQSDHLSLKLYGQAAFLMDDDDELSFADAADQGVTPGNRKAKGPLKNANQVYNYLKPISKDSNKRINWMNPFTVQLQGTDLLGKQLGVENVNVGFLKK